MFQGVCSRRLVVFTCAAVLPLVLLASRANATDRLVPSQYPTIQAAITAAVAGDEVVVANGVYTGTGNKNLDFGGKAITVRSASGNAAACIIDCEGNGRGFYFHTGESSATVLQGLTIRNGCVTSSSPGGSSGGAVYCGNSAGPTLANCVISESTAVAGQGGGLAYYGPSQPTVTACIIIGNTATSGGGLYSSNATMTLSSCSIIGNSANWPSDGPKGGGIYCTGGSLTATNCTATDNTAFWQAGGIYAYYTNLTFTNCTVGRNSSLSDGGGVLCVALTTAAITNCILWGDTPNEISLVNSTAAATYSDIQGGYTGTGNINVDPGFALGYDFHLTPGSPCIDTGTNTPAGGLPTADADGNPRALDGNGDGQVVADMGAYEFTPSASVLAVSPPQMVFYVPQGQIGQEPQTLSIRNAGTESLPWSLGGSPSWLQADASEGESSGEVNTVTLTPDASALSRGAYYANLEVTAPQANNSPRKVEVVLYVLRSLQVPSQYATIQAAINAAIAPIDQVVLADGVYTGTGNKDLDFGGKAIRVRSASGNPATCVIDCQGSGRGFYFHAGEPSSAVVQDLTIRNGYVTNSSPGEAAKGGAIYCSLYARPTVRNCVLTGNTAAAGQGGAVASGWYSRAMLIGCTISGNTATSGGGVYDDSMLTLSNCSITGNFAASGSVASGGGIHCNGGRTTLVNCTISGNTAYSKGAGVYAFQATVTLTNCSICRNTGFVGAGGTDCTAGSTIIINCILWEDTPTEVSFYNNPATVTYSDIQGGYTGTGNINVDPGFALGYDLHLTPGSPCIDTGTNTPASGLPTADADGNPRALDGNGDGQVVADMGAYELTPSASVLAVSPPRVVFYVPQGQIGQEPQTLSIRNAGTESLPWSLGGSPSWLQADVVEGVSSGEVDTVTLIADASALTYGSYFAMLQVDASQASNSPRRVEVVLHVLRSLQVPSQYASIQAAIDAVVPPNDEVVVADGVYTGTGNKNLDFGGKAITVRSASGDPTLCIIDCQGSGRGFYFHSGETSLAAVVGITIRNGYVTSSSPGGANGGGLYYSSYARPTIRNCVLSGNRAVSGKGGGLSCYSSSRPLLTGCTISGNTAASGGGVYSESGPTLSGCSLSGNSASGSGASGGGVYGGSGSLTLTNCMIGGNTAYSKGAGMYCHGVALTLTNCSIVGNTGSAGAGGTDCTVGSATITNCVLWGNTPTEVSFWNNPATVTYCDIQGGYTGIGNINLNPLFVDPDGPDNNPNTWQDNNYRLAAGSPCIDAGQNSAVPAGVTTDPDGNPRFVDDPASPDCRYVPGTCGTAPLVDMGSYEYQTIPGDLNGDRAVDGADFAIFLAAYGRCTGDAQYNALADLNGDGCVTLVDYQLWLQCYRDFNGDPFAPPPAPSDLGDVNGDGAVDGDDIQPFVEVILNPSSADLRQRFVTDFNRDGHSDAADVAGFVERLLGD